MAHLTYILNRQCKIHFSQKLQRTLELYSRSCRLFGDEITKRMLNRMKKSLLLSGKSFFLSAVCLKQYDWDKNRISDEVMNRSVSEYETINQLWNATVICQKCLQRKIIDKQISGVNYCSCSSPLFDPKYEGWEPYLERRNIVVWRKKHDTLSHLYAYKVYGTYEDLSACAFMETQLNTTHRSNWDTSVLEVKIVESEAQSNSDLIYWLVKYPYFMANRDYIFKRRFQIDENKLEMVIINDLDLEPVQVVPKVDRIHRVESYWSAMVIRSTSSFHEPGMSYTLTYFDDPGTSLPSPVTNFVACAAFPDFLSKVYEASVKIQQQWNDGQDVYVSLPENLRKSELQNSRVRLKIAQDSTSFTSVDEEIVQDPTSLAKNKGITQKTQELVQKTSESEKLCLQKPPIEERQSSIELLENQSTQRNEKTQTFSANLSPNSSDLSHSSNFELQSSQNLECQSDSKSEIPKSTPSGSTDPVPYLSNKKTSTNNSASNCNNNYTSISIDNNKSNNNSNNDNNFKLKALLEALEIIFPSKNETSLTIEKFVEKLEVNDNQKSILKQRFNILLKRALHLLQQGAKKREESMECMKEVQKRYYDQPNEELIVFIELLQSFNTLMMKDKDMRTGKLILNENNNVSSKEC